MAETSSGSIEPDYTKHRKKDLLTVAQQSILVLAGILILGITYINTYAYPFAPDKGACPLAISLLLAVNLIGIYICYLLVLKQLHIHSRYADKICTLFSKSDCNNVLESDAAKLFGIFGWSEIGLGYFAANTIILLFLPHLIHWLVLINILALPYTVWSVWYQKVKAHQWCPLCLIVQLLLWTIFLINAVCGYITNKYLFYPPLEGAGGGLIAQLIIVSCIYAIPIITLTLLLPKLSESNQVSQLRQEINSIKSNEDIFRTLLTQQPCYEVSRSDSQILFGNPEALLKISILSNPFCNPYAKMHARVETLLKETKGNVCIQYIFPAFDKRFEYANRYFIAIYLEKGSAIAQQLYFEWFEKGKAQQETFFKDMQLDMTNPVIEVEFQKHQSWKEKT